MLKTHYFLSVTFSILLFLIGTISAFFIFSQPVSAASYSGFKLIQSHRSIDIVPGKGFTFSVGFKNTGDQIWHRTGPSYVSLYIDSDRETRYFHPFWPSRQQASILSTVSESVQPGEIGYLRFALQAPDEEGDWPAKFRLAAEDTAWIDGAVLDIVMHVRNPVVVQSDSPDNSVLAETPRVNSNDQDIRVALAKINAPVTFTASHDIQLSDGINFVTSVLANQMVKVQHLSGTNFLVQVGNQQFNLARALFLASDDSNIFTISSFSNRPAWNPAINDNRFRGSLDLQFSSTSNTAWLINQLSLEKYLAGVAEIGNNYPTEYVKALSLAARTYATYHLNRGGKHVGESFHLKNSINGNGDDQVYSGYGFESRAFASPGYSFPEAVKFTSGQIIAYQDGPIIAAYSSDSGGQAKDAREVWSRSFYSNHPYLWGIDSRGNKILDPVNTIHNSSSIVASHGVGMSGAGARQMAREGKAFTDIINYYYPGVIITQ